VRAQNAALIICKTDTYTIFKVFEVQTPSTDVTSCVGKLLRSFPGSVIEVPAAVAHDRSFLGQLARMLCQLDIEQIEDAKTAPVQGRSRGGRAVPEPAHPKYISQLLVGILRGQGRELNVERTRKRIADDVLAKKDAADAPWRRSPVWLIIRVVLQMSSASTLEYKSFMLFFFSQLLSLCTQEGLDSEILFITRAKMARRFHKLRDHVPAVQSPPVEDPDVIMIDSDDDDVQEMRPDQPGSPETPLIPAFVVDAVTDAAEQAGKLLRDRWTNVETQQRQPAEWDPDSLDFERDTSLSLTNSRAYLHHLLRSDDAPPPLVAFEPAIIPRIRSNDFEAYTNDKLKAAYEASGRVALRDFEDAVLNHLDTWIHDRISDATLRKDGCKVLWSCCDQYHAAFKKEYAQPDKSDMSLAILVTTSLWYGVDRFATKHFPFLGEYSPEIPSARTFLYLIRCFTLTLRRQTFLEPLLLRERHHVERSIKLENYIRRRHGRHGGEKADISIFSDRPDDNAFTNRYFAASRYMQQQMDAIEADAARKHEAKVAELQRANDAYNAERRRIAQMACESRSRSAGERVHKRTTCPKCKAETLLNGRRIEVFEWPLPDEELQAQAVVFELNVPPIFGIWRSITYLVVADLGLPDRATHRARPETTHHAYPGLKDHVHYHSGSRISFAVSSGLNSTSTRSIPASESDVCIPHGIQHQLYDTRTGCWASGPFKSSNVIVHGTLQLEERSPYHYLQFAVQGTDHSTNSVIAHQSDCPATLSIHEHQAFGSLRSGPLLQWPNILRELASNALSFRREEVYTLVTQAAWQVGTLYGSNSRVWHQGLEDEGYGARLVEVCREMLVNVRANWTEGGTIKLLGAI
jgi:hypothetical protein